MYIYKWAIYTFMEFMEFSQWEWCPFEEILATVQKIFELRKFSWTGRIISLALTLTFWLSMNTNRMKRIKWLCSFSKFRQFVDMIHCSFPKSGGGLKYFLFLPRSLGRNAPIWLILFKWVAENQEPVKMFCFHTPWKINMEPINHPWKERKLIGTKPPWLGCSINLYFQRLSTRGVLPIRQLHNPPGLEPLTDCLSRAKRGLRAGRVDELSNGGFLK